MRKAPITAFRVERRPSSEAEAHAVWEEGLGGREQQVQMVTLLLDAVCHVGVTINSTWGLSWMFENPSYNS